MNTFNLESTVEHIEYVEAISLTIRTGKPVYMTEQGKLTVKPNRPAVRILEPINLQNRGVEFRKFTTAEDYLGEHGGWGFRHNGEVLCYGWEVGDKAETAHHIAAEINAFSDLERRMAELLDTLQFVSRHSYEDDQDWAHATAETDITGLLASLQ